MRLFAGVLRVLAAAVACVPFGWLRALGAALGWFVANVVRVRRAHVEDAMRGAGVREPATQAAEMYGALGVSALEFLWLAGRGGRGLAAHTRWDEGLACVLDEARREGRGVVIAASHTGNWELAACALAERRELTVVTKRISMPAFDAFAKSARAAHGVRLAEGEGALASALAALSRGEVVALLIDQVPERREHAVSVSFLGRAALADRTPATLAARTGAPLIVTASRRLPDGSHAMALLAVLTPPSDADRAWVDHATREATHALDSFVRAHPSQWLWLHRRWREPRRPRALSSSTAAGTSWAPCATPSSSTESPSRAASS